MAFPLAPSMGPGGLTPQIVQMLLANSNSPTAQQMLHGLGVAAAVRGSRDLATPGNFAGQQMQGVATPNPGVGPAGTPDGGFSTPSLLDASPAQLQEFFRRMSALREPQPGIWPEDAKGFTGGAGQ